MSDRENRTFLRGGILGLMDKINGFFETFCSNGQN